MNQILATFLIATTLLTQTTLHADERPLVVAHRGASHDAPENTLAAFKLAWQRGADAIEGDFFLTADGQIVCTHDATTERLNKQKKKLVVAKSTLAELRKLDVGSWKHAKFAGERMPTLAEVLATVPKGKRIYIEVKCGLEIMPKLKSEIASSKLKPEQIVVISFKKQVVASSKKLLPRSKAFWLSSFKPEKKGSQVLTPSEIAVRANLKDSKADGIGCGDHALLSEKFFKSIRGAGYETHSWTINDPARAKKLAGMGIQSITTDRPALIRKALEAKKAVTSPK